MTTYRPGLRRSRRKAAVAGLAAGALLLVAGCSSADPGVAGSTEDTIPVAGPAEAVQQQFVRVVHATSPSVVLIRTDDGIGSGVVFDRMGDIVTNNHVVAGSHTFQVTLDTGKQYPGRFMGSFGADDLAVPRINAPGLQAADFARSSDLSVGDIVLAIGNPLGLKSSVTEGMISGLGRTVTEDNRVTLPNTIQTSDGTAVEAVLRQNPVAAVPHTTNGHRIPRG